MDARQEIIEVGRQLHDEGLLVRTWGNISCRESRDHMLITPSGIRYEDLTPDMIVRVNIKDLGYSGKYKPSSEMMVHAACYLSRPACRFIVHTHQTYATVVSALGLREIRTVYDGEDMRIHCSPYGMPGTRALAASVRETLEKYKHDDGIIMSNHGTVCMGTISDEAVENAMQMEDACLNFLHGYCRMDIESGLDNGYDSHLENGAIVYADPTTPFRVKMIHEEIYHKRPDISYIVHNKSEACKIVSRRATYMRPLLDDFAQLVGTHVRVPFNFHGRDGRKIIVEKKVNAVFTVDDGAYCLGATREDALATAIVVDKGCLAQIAAARFGRASYLSAMDCFKMNRHYRNSYSKLANGQNRKLDN